MDIPILVEPISANQYRASTGEPLQLETEAPTRAEAIQKLRELIDRRVKAGAELIALPVGSSVHPLSYFAGMMRDDPLVQPWKQAMAEYRDRSDGATDTP
jgi:hypothetical protein